VVARGEEYFTQMANWWHGFKSGRDVNMERMNGDYRSRAIIKVLGVGGGGGNALNHMIASNLEGVEFIAINTDAQDLAKSLAHKKVQIGQRLTGGLGTGGDPNIGKQAAEADRDAIASALERVDMVFIAAGMGGGTGTGASPVIAQIARDMGALTVAVVTKPFTEEGPLKMKIALEGIQELKQYVDAVITIPNDRIWQLADRRLSLKDAFEMVDEVLRMAVQGISDLIVRPGYINIDFADVRSILSNAGIALIGIGSGRGDERSADAARNAISSPLLEYSIEGATRALVNIVAPMDMPVSELHEMLNIIREASGVKELDLRMGLVLDEGMGDEVRVTLIATGFETEPTKPAEAVEKVSVRQPRREGREPVSTPSGVEAPRQEARQPVRSIDEILREVDEGIDTPTFLRRSHGRSESG
jgi:cell division protein FtsZ